MVSFSEKHHHSHIQECGGGNLYKSYPSHHVHPHVTCWSFPDGFCLSSTGNTFPLVPLILLSVAISEDTQCKHIKMSEEEKTVRSTWAACVDRELTSVRSLLLVSPRHRQRTARAPSRQPLRDLWTLTMNRKTRMLHLALPRQHSKLPPRHPQLPHQSHPGH